MEVLNLIFKNFWTWLGTLILLYVLLYFIVNMIVGIFRSFSKSKPYQENTLLREWYETQLNNDAFLKPYDKLSDEEKRTLENLHSFAMFQLDKHCMKIKKEIHG